ncbi:malate dehydrogenase (quinone) [Marinomonas mediterranea]|jgi:malate:quinone-oxidoreductase|uniref:Probable malate:quinone oxidoreductase n=1 Tax=Marinomonas mediterranea (strain ATCC 700492 / JCM 21426 / NBRC 103028 / MMB-1) TaxID=717774 RepID=F2K186_MARM1|nr:malate dehydrogenase (quinone) [Marinomonas mediterranea]ADZ89936.1 malate:quinone oxidoreductase [Marinomonas mediterranea MMB-1]WCN08015.1 malate dehydrogenase (quinone) [Marinomonas mediterranea]WCN12110.1 malate dehydrogenase (quinone) [Marinomonas mediterranea]WCN16147.1 malate dehydrogenase (quinone) [Marinomonas mediterranea MMB-1]
MTTNSVDVLLVGAGAMSTTLGVLLKELDPTISITMLERLDSIAQESTDGWNNAGTGHAAYCELNYTSENADGTTNIDKAVNINTAFEVSLQFWSYLVEKGLLPSPKQFINRVPHLSFVWGDDNVKSLKSRHKAMSAHPAFKEMQYSEDIDTLNEWMPLIMRDRKNTEKLAATRIEHGSDVNFGAIARNMTKHLTSLSDFNVELNANVSDLKQQKDGSWDVEFNQNGKNNKVNAKFVFLGAGGGALPLLQKSGVKEAKGYGGFPVSGQWLVCEKPELVEQHYAKVYGAAPIGAPPMSVPHLDTRIIDGKRAILFGPFAGFTTKFLKNGSKLDMFKSIQADNLIPMLRVGKNNMDLTKYLISEVKQSHADRCDSLRNFFPNASNEDWKLAYAGQRVQIIKKTEDGGKLEFGTEAITSEDGTLAALLGASPGASTTVNTMIKILESCFKERISSSEWQTKMKEMVPSYGQSLVENTDLLLEVRKHTLETLQLKPVESES